MRVSVAKQVAPSAGRRGSLPPGRGGKASRLILAGFLGLLSLRCGGSRHAPEPTAPPPEPLAEAPYLLDPAEGLPVAPDPTRLDAVERAYRRLLAGESPEEIKAQAGKLLEIDPSFAPALLLEAQTSLVTGEAASALATCRALTERLAGYTAAELLLARSAEKTGELLTAFEAYRLAAERSSVAAERAEELRPRAVEVLGNRVEEALRLDHLEEARELGHRLVELAPQSEITWEAARHVALVAGDRKAELAAVVWLAERQPGRSELIERRGDLELELGRPEAAIAAYQSLLQGDPENPVFLDKLDRAKFRFRVVVLPGAVRALVRQDNLSRSGVAALCYWLMPEIRGARPARALIASDIVGHPLREEIARVVNLELMDLDATLHRFAPEAPASRALALRTLLRASTAGLAGQACAVPADAAGKEGLCQAAARCGWLRDVPDCLAAEGISGEGMIELIRQSLHR